MNLSIKKIVLVLLLSFGMANSQTLIPYYKTVADQCSQANITSNLAQFESYGIKTRGTASLENTLNWLKAKYLSYGYTAAQIEEDPFTYSGSLAVCKNLVITKIGTLHPNKFVIIDAHYDSRTGKGTNDNGSGVSIILEVARLLQNIPTECSIKFINFSGEEEGFYGSQHYVDAVVNATNPKMDIKLVFNIDEVGGTAGAVNTAITCEHDTGSPTANNAASDLVTNELINCVGLYSPLQTYLSYAYGSDYMPFEANLEVITGFFERNESVHRHKSTDLLVNMDPVYVFKIAKAAIGATMHFATASTTLKNETFENDFNVSFFPNPTKDTLNINLGSLPEIKYMFSLVDVNGKTVLKKQIDNAKLIEQIAISEFAKGVYLGILEAGEKRITKKVVIE